LGKIITHAGITIIFTPALPSGAEREKYQMDRSKKIFTAIRLSVFIIVPVLFFQTTVFGLNFSWTGKKGDWSDRGNWSLRRVPNGSTHLAMIFKGHASLSADNFSLESLFIGSKEGYSDGSLCLISGGHLDVKQYVMVGSNSGIGAITVSGRDSFLRARNDTWIAHTGKGKLIVMDGGRYESLFLKIGDIPGASGTVAVSGQDSQLAARSVILGAGNVQMFIRDGGTFKADTLYSAAQSGSGLKAVTVSGPGAHLDSKKIWWKSNETGTALLNVTDRGYISTDTLYIDSLSGSGSTVTVSWGGRIDVQEAILAVNGTGALNIENGAFVDIKKFTLGDGHDSSGTVTVKGPGSTFITGENTWIGNHGKGTVNISDGAFMRSGKFNVGRYKGKGHVTVSGQGSRNEVNAAYIGTFRDGEGFLNITDGGFMSSRSFFVGYQHGSTGSAIVSGPESSLEAGHAWIGYGGEGTLNIMDGGYMSSEGFKVGEGAFKTEEGVYAIGTVTVSGHGSLLETQNTVIGSEGRGNLAVLNGGVVNSRSLTAGELNDSFGEITVSGPASQVTSKEVWIGDLGSGTLHLGDSGLMTSEHVFIGLGPGSRGTVTVSDLDSRVETDAVQIGISGQGALRLTAGGQMAAGEIIAGKESGGSGTVSVSASGSRLESTNAQIGYGSQGTLDITAGGSAHLDNLQVGKYPGTSGTVSVSGADSSLTAVNTWIGNNGEGILNITAGGQVYSRLFTYGQYPDATGTVTVAGPGSRLDTRTAWINSGTGRTLKIQDGGHMRSENMSIRGSTITVSGENSLLSSQKMTLAGEDVDPGISVTNGGELQVEQFFEIGANGALKVSNGGRFTMGPDSFFNISSPGASAAFTDTAFFDGHVHVNGTLSAPASVFSSGSLLTGSQGVIQGDVTMNGTLSPGGANDPVSSPGTLFINGNYTHEQDSRYVAGIDVDTQVSDRVEVSGSTTLNGGTIEAVWTGHVTGNERFTVLTSSSIC
jgi:fibronectin-binding autotransporter adhesin